jgi:acid stress-induced BolA-like protein IbaG/YrbA
MIQRHRIIYQSLGSLVGNEIHALALKAFTVEES